MTTRVRAAAAMALFSLLTVTGCGPAPGPAVSSPDAEGGDVPTTARSLAFVVAEHTGRPSSAAAEVDASGEFAEGGVGAELRYGSDGEYDGDSLTVAVGKGLDASLLDCDSEASESLSGCVQSSEGTLLWEGEVPEEDPGVVYLVVPKGDAHVLIFYSGPVIEDDPRTLDMPISVEDLFDIAADPRVDVTTSQAAVDGGQNLTFWQH